jgi:hypothetical protein
VIFALGLSLVLRRRVVAIPDLVPLNLEERVS